jgi:outer membrane scaffolding protein for murein synthesis (MipA/OmpV family)
MSYAISKSFPLVLRADVRQLVGGADGMVADIGAYMPLPGSSQRLVMFAGPSYTYADHLYMHKEFGVTTAQSIASGYPVYDAHAGSDAVGFGFSATGFITEHWLINLDTAINHLLGSAAYSPITQKTTQHVVALSLAYSW